MLIECYKCEAVVDGRMIAQHESYDPQDDPDVFRVYLLECPRCKTSLFAGDYEFEDGPPCRLWPSPRKSVSSYIPPEIRVSLREADKCYRAGALLACAVMCGRSLEGVCKHFKVKSRQLHGGLKELKERGVIDARLFEWSEALRGARNAAAHATDEKVSKEDARDLLDLVTAICDYVFVFSERFSDFMRRRAESSAGEAANPVDRADGDRAIAPSRRSST
jgi:hypothetical protein